MVLHEHWAEVVGGRSSVVATRPRRMCNGIIAVPHTTNERNDNVTYAQRQPPIDTGTVRPLHETLRIESPQLLFSPLGGAVLGNRSQKTTDHFLLASSIFYFPARTCTRTNAADPRMNSLQDSRESGGERTGLLFFTVLSKRKGDVFMDRTKTTIGESHFRVALETRRYIPHGHHL